MKTMTRILTVAAMLALVAVIAAPIASANCLPNKTMTTWGIGGYHYVNLPAGSNNSNVVGKFWQAAGRTLANEGTFDDTNWLRLCPASSCGSEKWYILGELGTAGVFGCPAGSLIVTLDTAAGQNLTVQLDETPAGNAFDLSRFGVDFNLGTKPRPQVGSSSRNGTNVDLQINLQAQTGGIYTLGTAVAATPSYQLVSASGTSDPGGLASAYAAGPALIPGGQTPFSANCSNPSADQWIAVQTIVDGVPADTVGPRTRISCNPALADPEFKHIDRPTRPNPRSGR